MSDNIEEFRPGVVVYGGNMGGGKTAHAILDAQRALVAGKKVQAFRLSWDNRYEEGYVTANNGQLKFPAFQVPGFDELSGAVEDDTEFLLVEEAHFFDERLIDLVREKRDSIRIVLTLLQHDYRGDPFPFRAIGDRETDSKKNVGELMALATIENKTYWPICTHSLDGRVCGMPAPYVQRWNPHTRELSTCDESTLAVGRVAKNEEGILGLLDGGEYAYAVRCFEHYVKPGRVDQKS